MKFTLSLISITFLVISCDNSEFKVAQRLKHLEDSLRNERRIVDSIRSVQVDSIGDVMAREAKEREDEEENYIKSDTIVTLLRKTYISDCQINESESSMEYGIYSIDLNYEYNILKYNDIKSGDSLICRFSYWKTTNEDDGEIKWYKLHNGRSNIYNTIKVKDFSYPQKTNNKFYKHLIIFSKYTNGIREYVDYGLFSN